VTSTANHWKIGLFVVLGLAIAMATVVFLGARSLKKDAITYVTLFDESVQGLELGSPVKFRGVTVGNVSRIDVASDQRHVAVYYELGTTILERLGLKKAGRDVKIDIPVDLRVQLASAGVTGVKFLQLDFFPVEQYPVPKLPFPEPDNYIPAAPSALKNIEDSVIRMVNNMPELSERLVTLLDRVNSIAAQIDDTRLPEHVTTSLEGVDRLVSEARRSLKALDADKLGKNGSQTLSSLSASAARLDRLLARVEKEDLLGSVKRASDNVGSIADGASLPVEELDKTLRSVQEAADSIRRLSDALERDSDMLLKGRTTAE
jgi:ABC-type transporter Mla subunit MlaD